jgi:hypothetical protein
VEEEEDEEEEEEEEEEEVGKMGMYLPNRTHQEEKILNQWPVQSFLFISTSSIYLVFQSSIE